MTFNVCINVVSFSPLLATTIFKPNKYFKIGILLCILWGRGKRVNIYACGNHRSYLRYLTKRQSKTSLIDFYWRHFLGFRTTNYTNFELLGPITSRKSKRAAGLNHFIYIQFSQTLNRLLAGSVGVRLSQVGSWTILASWATEQLSYEWTVLHLQGCVQVLMECPWANCIFFKWILFYCQK